MNPDDLARILDELAARLGPGGEYVFGLAVRQAYIGAIAHVVVAIASGLAAVLMWRQIVAYRKRDWARWDALPDADKGYPTLNGKPDDIAGNGTAVLLYVIPMSLGFVALHSVTAAITQLLNPEYAALIDILSRIVPQ